MSESGIDWLSKMDEISAQYASATVAFLTMPSNVPAGVSAAEAYGSGFLLNYRKQIFLVTACHVIEKAETVDTIIRTKHGSMRLLNTHFRVYKDCDIAAAIVGPMLFKNAIKGYETVPIVEPSYPHNRLPIALFIGHPNTLNRVDHRSSNRDFKCLSLSVVEKTTSKVLSKIENPIYFEFYRNKFTPGVNISPQTRTVPQPYGMSGGPVLGIFANPEDNCLQASLIGIAAEWNRNEAALIAANCIDLWPLLDNFFDR